MKVCLILMGPIAGNDRIYYDGEEIVLEDATATLFAGWGFVEILRDAESESPVAGKLQEAEPVTQKRKPKVEPEAMAELAP